MGDIFSFCQMEGQYIIQQAGREEEEEEGPREGELREQDRFLPIYNISKVMKKVVPQSGKVAKEARECVQECVSEFISFITSEASDRCQAEKRKTINGEDILFAMSTLGFDNYVEPLKLYLQKYREAMKGDKASEGFDDINDVLQVNSQGAGQVLLAYNSDNQSFHLS